MKYDKARTLIKVHFFLQYNQIIREIEKVRKKQEQLNTGF